MDQWNRRESGGKKEWDETRMRLGPGLVRSQQCFLWSWRVLELEAGLCLFEQYLVIVTEMSREKTRIDVGSARTGVYGAQACLLFSN